MAEAGDGKAGALHAIGTQPSFACFPPQNQRLRRPVAAGSSVATSRNHRAIRPSVLSTAKTDMPRKFFGDQLLCQLAPAETLNWRCSAQQSGAQALSRKGRNGQLGRPAFFPPRPSGPCGKGFQFADYPPDQTGSTCATFSSYGGYWQAPNLL